MTAICKTCGAEIAQRFVGSTLVWGHLTNPRQAHHYAVPARRPSQPPGTPERRAS